MKTHKSINSKLAINKTKTMKLISSIIPIQRSHWVGDGFAVTPLFGELAFTNALSPFLMLDYGAPKKFEPTKSRRGVGQHPHRGFETVTIAFSGEIEHGDSHGNHGIIGPGDVQWMTAASGIIHEEFHSTNFAKTGGLMEMVQLWVNLPAKDKFAPAKYQPILAGDIPEVPIPNSDTDASSAAGSVRIIAGEYNGVRGPATTFTPINIWDISLASGASVELDIPADHNSMLVIRDGALSHNQDENKKHTELPPQQLVVFNNDHTNALLSLTAKRNSKFLLLTGVPINEPIAARGPFVLNTQQELRQAMIDYETGNFIKE